MIKSLYVRVVLTFIASVMLSLVFAFVLATLFYRNQVTTSMQEELVTTGKQIISNYNLSAADNIGNFNKGIEMTPNYRIQIYTTDGHPVIAHNGNKLQPAVQKEQVDYVLHGGVYRGEMVSGEYKGLDRMLIGLPFQTNKGTYALFISPDNPGMIEQLSQLLRAVLVIVLVFGSLFIVIASRYLVKPLHQLTEATRRLAKGDFSIHVQSKRKDEIGILTTSINEMAVELGKLDQMRQDFVANVSHEIQSPLTSISGFTKALRNKEMDEAKRIRYLTIIEEESERLSRLSENLLKLSSLQYENQPLHPQYYRLDEQLRGIVIACEPQWAAKKLAMDLQLEDVIVQADEDQLNQVWLNLIHNSIKFTPDQGMIRIELFSRNGFAHVTITDTGSGIPDGEIDDIFKPFYKVDKSRTGTLSGSGLGLSIVKRIIDIHHGDIQVISTPGAGTVMKIKLLLEPEL